MNPFFEYLIKSSVSLALFYIVFKLAVSRDKMHSVNRFVLLSILIFSAIIPFADVPVFREIPVIPKVEVFREFVAPPVFTAEPVFESIQPVRETKSIHINPYLLFYILIISALFIRLLVSAIRVMQIINGAEKRRFRKIVLAVVKDIIQPFTFIKHIVISERDFTENKEIIVTHEYAHIKHLHAIDLFVCGLFTVLHFFNPFMWFLRRDLKLIHEFQADQTVLNKGIDATKYQLLVLQKSVGERRFALANYFSQKPILKRLKMMQKKNRKQWKGVKLILFIPIILLLLQAFAQPEMLVEKAGEFVPSIIQKDSSEIWLDNWTIENLKNINGGLVIEEYEVIPPPPGYSKSNLSKYDKDKHGGVQIPMTNILSILVNRNNMILVCNTKADKNELLSGVAKFLKGSPPFPEIKKGPEMVEKNFSDVGYAKVSKGVITIRYDRDIKKEFIQNLLRSIGEKHLEARQNISEEFFGTDYFLLSSEKKDVINQMIPIRVSILPPKTVKPPPPPPPKQKQKSTNNSIYSPKGYDVIIHKDHLEVFNENCTINELNERVEKILTKEKDKKSIAILTFEDVPPERLKKIKFEINNIPDIKISTTIVKLLETDAESISHKILLKEDGDIYINDEKYSLPEFEKQIEQLSENMKNGSTLNAVFEIENNATYMQVETVKEILRKANVKQLQHEIEHHSISEITPFADNTQPGHAFGVSLGGPLTSQQLERIMASAKNLLKKPNTIQATIYTYMSTSKDDIETLKEELLNAGYKKVSVKER